jgi:hypothetical protein
MRRRDDQEDKTYFRSERVFGMNGQWYFSSREGDSGPFATPVAARRALDRFLTEKVELAAFQRARERDIPKPRLTLAERLQLDNVVSPRAFTPPELLI